MATAAVHMYDVSAMDMGKPGMSLYKTLPQSSNGTVSPKRKFALPKTRRSGGQGSTSRGPPSVVTETDRRFRVNPELVPLLQNRHGFSTRKSSLSRPLPPRTAGTTSEFETECIRKIWTELNQQRKIGIKPLEHQPRKGTPEIKLGERELILEDLERMAMNQSATLGKRAHTLAEIERRIQTSHLSAADKRPTMRSERARRNELKSAQFYTSITKRMPKKSPAPIRALTQVAPSIPPLYGSRPPSYTYRHKDLDIWRREVKKEVPNRPDLTIPTDYKPRHDWNFEEEIVQYSDPLFYNSKEKPLSKEYMVDREWFSEKVNNFKAKGASQNLFVSF